MKETFTITKDGKEIKLAVVTPNTKANNDGLRAYNRAFKLALESGAIFKKRLLEYMEEQGLWGKDKEVAVATIAIEIEELVKKLKGGGIKLSEAKELAIQISSKRRQQTELWSDFISLETNTIEGQAENARFAALVAACLVYNDSGERYYRDVEEYNEHAADDEAYMAAQILAGMLHNVDKDWELNLPENQFLKKYGFVDDKLRFINKEGHLVDASGRLVNEAGLLVDENENPIDKNGNPIDPTTLSPIVEEKPFLDDEGNPV